MRKIFSILVLLTIIFSSCRYIGGKRVHGNGNIVTKERSVSGFNQVEVSGAIDVYVKQDSLQQPVKVETDENLQELIEVSEHNGVLYIAPADNFNLDPTRAIKVYVSAPFYRGFHVSGASEIRSENKLVSTETMDIDVSGASEVKLDLKAPRVNADISGASSADLIGETKDLNLQGSGASHYKCFDLMAENTTVDISGACSADVFASVKLDVQASGASGVKYRGAASVSQDVSGASSVKKVD